MENNYLIEKRAIPDQRGNYSSLSSTIPTSLDYSTYKVLRASLQNVRLEPIKPRDRAKQCSSMIDKSGPPALSPGASTRVTPRIRFDVAQSLDISANRLRDRLSGQQELSVGEVAGTGGPSVLYRFGVDGYNLPIADHRYQVRNTIGTQAPRRNFAEIEAINR